MRKLVMLLLGVLLLCGQLLAQTRVITGKVLDSFGNPVPNATILIKGSASGTSSRADGSFSISVPANARALVVSSVGLAPKEVALSAGTNSLSISLSAADKILDEVIVTGVGAATSRKKVAISVESLTAKDLPKVSTASIDQALVGKIAGAQINSTSGQPGQQASILLRGINNVRGTQPMILVDGVQVQAGGNSNGSGTNVSSRLSDLDLSNVDRIEVVQGAAAATIYGAQGANGVIQIFTKKGMRDGKVRINFNSRVSVDNVLRGNLEFAKYHFYETDAEGYILNNSNVRLRPNSATQIWPLPKQPASLLNALNNKPFREETFDNVGNVFIKNATTFNNSVTVSGGREKIDFALTLSNLSQESIVFGDYKRTNLSLNVGAELFKGFTIRSITQLAFSDNSTGTITGQNNINSPLGTAINQRQYVNLMQKDSIGNYVANLSQSETAINPFYSQQFRNYSAKNTRIIQNMNLNYKPFKVLELDYKYGLDNYVYDFRNFIAYQRNSLTPANGIGPTNGSVSYSNDNETSKNSLLSAFLRLDFEDDLNINLPISSTTQVAYDYRRRRYLGTSVTGTGFAPFPPYTLRGTVQSGAESTEIFVSYGYLVNQKFDYGNLFGVSGGFRTDYSSAFGAGSKPFTFPRGDAYFRLSELINAQAISELKFRGAYGKAGIQPGAYDRQPVLNNGSIGSDGYLAVQAGANNPLLNVEVSEEIEVGADMGFRLGEKSLRNVRLSATYWTRKSTDVIRAIDVAPSSGTATILTNALSLSSNGFQASLDADLLNTENVTWDFGIRFGSSKSMVDKISNGKEIALGTSGAGEFVLKENTSIGAFFGVQPLNNLDQTNSLGVRYIAEANKGNYEVVNGYVVNKATKQVEFTTEKVQIGDPNPKFNMTFLNNFTLFKNLGVSFQFDWVYGNKIYNQTRQWMYRDFLSADFDKEITIDGNTGAFVNYYSSLYRTNNTNSHFVEDGSYLRMRDLTFSYRLTEVVKNLKFINNAEIAVSGRNLFTVTNYSGIDPEASAAFNNPLRRGLDLYAFPNFRTYQFSLTLGF